jgi:hypothetical protein
MLGASMSRCDSHSQESYRERLQESPAIVFLARWWYGQRLAQPTDAALTLSQRSLHAETVSRQLMLQVPSLVSRVPGRSAGRVTDVAAWR